MTSLPQWIALHRRVFALTGAGCSTASGIPDYRDEHGEWSGGRRS
jgi:NAD-dependent SIR2 family protein deacetylase